jgi:hypothetical protein
MPEFVDILAQHYAFHSLRVLHQHREVGSVCALDAFCVLAGPTFSPLGIHESESDRFQVESLHCSNGLLYGSICDSRLHSASSSELLNNRRQVERLIADITYV